MPVVLAVAGSFLLGVLCMDLAFDLQAVGSATDTTATLASISAYYGRILSDSNPMGNLVVAAMLVAIFGAVYETIVARRRRWLPGFALALGALAIGVTATEVLPSAGRIVAGTDPNSAQLDLARRIAIAHVFCFSAFVGYVAVQVSLSVTKRELAT